MLSSRAWFIVVIAALSLVAGKAEAQNAPAGWQQIVNKAKAQKLVMINQGNPAFDAAIGAFTKKYGIEVEAAVSRPSMAITRVRTEQKNNRYLVDVWWAITGLMTSVASPAGMFAKFEEFLVLPEVKDPSSWRHADYLYGDAARAVFTYSHEVNSSIYRNVNVLPELKIETVESLMDPRLKGKIAVRDASYPNAGSYALTPIYKAKGADYLMNFLKSQEPRIYENPEQIDTALIRGAAAVAIGGQGSSFSQCRADGGCKHIEPVEEIANVTSRGFAVLKNPPNPEATKVFVNWILSKEGQELLVREWAKANATGAVSMRKDVPPAKGHEDNLPNFSKAERYVFVATQKGADEIKVVTDVFKKWSGK